MDALDQHPTKSPGPKPAIVRRKISNRNEGAFGKTLQNLGQTILLGCKVFS